MIPDIGALREDFVPLIEQSEAFSATERRDALATMFSAHGYEWSFLCPARPGKRALLIPAPWSLTPLVLADRFAELVVWEPHRKRAELLDRYYNSLSLPIRVIGAPLDRLALHPERYAVVAFEDSFARRGCDPADVESWAAKLLEAGGQCCIVTASRFGRSIWKGNMLSLSRELGRLFKHGNLLPSLHGVRRRMRRASLEQQRAYSFYPDHRKPREILGWNGSLPHHIRGTFYRLLDRLGFAARMHDGFMIVAGQERPTSGFVDELLTHLQEELSLNERPAVEECRVQRTGVMLLFLDLQQRGGAVLRVPLHRRAKLRMEANDRALATLAAKAPQIHSFAPEMLSSGSLNRVPYSLERKLSGVPADDVITKPGNERWIVDEAFQFVERLARVQARYQRVDQAFRSTYLQPPCDVLRAHFPELSEEVNELESFLDRSTRGQRIPLIWVHGDFNTKNVLVDPAERKLTGVIDWDLVQESGLPLHDLLHFILSMHRRRSQIGIGEVVVRALQGGLLDAHEQASLDRYCTLFDLQPNLVEPMLLVYWARHVAPKSFKGGRVPGDTWSEKHVIEPLQKIRWLIK